LGDARILKSGSLPNSSGRDSARDYIGRIIECGRDEIGVKANENSVIATFDLNLLAARILYHCRSKPAFVG